MNEIAFEIAEYVRDRELTVRQLAASRGMGAYVEKYTAQLARIDARLRELRAISQVSP